MDLETLYSGVGKSTILAMIAGKLSSGGVFPCDTLHQQPSIVIFQTGEIIQLLRRRRGLLQLVLI